MLMALANSDRDGSQARFWRINNKASIRPSVRPSSSVIMDGPPACPPATLLSRSPLRPWQARAGAESNFERGKKKGQRRAARARICPEPESELGRHDVMRAHALAVIAATSITAMLRAFFSL